MIYQIVGWSILAVAVIDIALRIYFGRKALQFLEKMPPFRVEPASPCKQAVPFNVDTADDLTLRGSIYHPEDMPPKGIVVFCAETIASHWSAVNYCAGLIENGFIVVSFDFRNQGESDVMAGYESLHWVTDYEIRDLNEVINWVKDQDAFAGLPIGVMGVSRGGSTALIAGSRRSDVQFICADSAYTNDLLISHYLERYAPILLPRFVMKYSARCMWHIKWTLYAAVWLRSFKRKCHYILSARPFERTKGNRVLLISGSSDSYVPPSLAKRMQSMFGKQCDELWIVPKASHNGARSKQPAEYDTKVAAFFSQMSPVETPTKPLAPRAVAREVSLPTD